MHNGVPGDQGSGLESLLTYIDQAYYHRLEGLCSRAEYHIAELHAGDVHQAASLYTSLSKKLIGQIAQYVRLRRYALVPYIHELLEKEDEGHDCRDCGRSCKVRHGSQIDSIRDAHTRIKETLYRLQSVTVAIAIGTELEAPYRALRNEMMQLDTALTELFYLEECSVIPKVLEAQNAIHARS